MSAVCPSQWPLLAHGRTHASAACWSSIHGRCEQHECGCPAWLKLHSVRLSWIPVVRPARERVQALMLVMECARGVPQFWASARLRDILPHGLLESMDLQEPRSLRLTVHHGFLPFVRNCPPDAAEPWLAAAFTQFLQLLGSRLNGAWPGLVARVTGEVGEAVAKQTEEEMIQEVLRTRTAALRSCDARSGRAVPGTSGAGAAGILQNALCRATDCERAACTCRRRMSVATGGKFAFSVPWCDPPHRLAMMHDDHA